MPTARVTEIIAALVSIALAAAWPAAAQGPGDRRLEQSREITARFASRLQSALQSAIGEAGPAAAIEVCRDLAPQIASELSRESGAKVERTSLRYRNPANAPEPWQAEVLRELERAAARGGQAGELERFETAEGIGARYMKAIPTGGLCLTCHGETIAPEVEAALDASYPHDLARGYALGEIRGAFSVTWPALRPAP